MQVAELPMLALLAKPTILAVTEEVEPVAVGLPMIKVVDEVLSATVELLIGEATKEAASKMAIWKVVGEAIIGTYEVTVTPTMASPEVGCMVGLLPAVTMGNNSRLHNSPPHASQVPDPLPGRPIDYLIQCL